MSMDIVRPEIARKKKMRRILYGAIVAVLLPLVTFAISRLKPAPPSVEGAQLWYGTVKRGEFLRQMRGLGTLVPEEIRWIPAQREGRVERIILRPGAIVKPDSVILVLSNPELERQALDSDLQLKSVEADFTNLKVQLQSQLLTQRAGAAAIEAQFSEAKLQAQVDEQLAKEGLVSDLNFKRSKVRADELAIRHDLEQKRLEIAAEAVQAQMAAQRARVDQSRALAELRRRELNALQVQAGVSGVLQIVPVEVGQQVAPGANLARVADPRRLKAEIRIPETQAKDVQIGQKATVDTRNGIVAGRVQRIDPAVQQGTVLVDVSLEGELPAGARPDLSVDGTIEIERLADVLYVERPVQGQPNSTVGLFKVIENGKEAIRVPVKLGRGSVNIIEVVEGLLVNEKIVLSDMSNMDGHDRIRIN